jgi:hypothetical protein
MARWITVRRPFDFHWPSRAITAFSEAHLGEHLVKDEVADFAVSGGYATEGKTDASVRSSKGAGKHRAKKGKPAAKATHSRSGNAVDHAHDADADRSADRHPLDPDAE